MKCHILLQAMFSKRTGPEFLVQNFEDRYIPLKSVHGCKKFQNSSGSRSYHSMSGYHFLNFYPEYPKVYQSENHQNGGPTVARCLFELKPPLRRAKGISPLVLPRYPRLYGGVVFKIMKMLRLWGINHRGRGMGHRHCRCVVTKRTPAPRFRSSRFAEAIT